MPDSYKHYVQSVGLSIEYNTEAVPKDGKYYLLQNGEVVQAFRSLRQAEQKFREILKKSNYLPEQVAVSKRSQGEMHVDRYLDAKDMYWAVSHKFKAKGGRGGRGGI